MNGDLISRDVLFDAMRDEEFQTFVPLDEVDEVIAKVPAVKAVEIPCDIGTVVYYTKPIMYNQESPNGVNRGKVVGIEINKNKRKFVWVHFDLQTKWSAIAIDFEKFGTDVFFSEEKALDAIKRKRAKMDAKEDDHD